MSEIKTVSARLDIEMFVECPSCDYMIDLLREEDTDVSVHSRTFFPSR